MQASAQARALAFCYNKIGQLSNLKTVRLPDVGVWGICYTVRDDGQDGLLWREPQVGV